MINLAILGAGNIARAMAATIAGMSEVNPYAVASRDLDRAKAFASEHGFERAYGSYEDMLKDDKVDLVYVATPHSHHYAHMMLCIEHGRNVLCEKAFTVNKEQAQEVFNAARAKRVLVTEAIWTRYMPSRSEITRIINEGMIGQVEMVTANLGYLINMVERLRKPELAGGALLDVGVYTINFAAMVLGDDIEDISGSAVLNEYGVDAQEGIIIRYRSGQLAVLNSTMNANTDLNGIVYGSKGRLVVDNINNCKHIDVYDNNRQRIYTYDAPKQITGYEYQVQACIEAMQAGWIECPQMPHQETIRMMDWMDRLRAQWGIRYPME